MRINTIKKNLFYKNNLKGAHGPGVMAVGKNPNYITNEHGVILQAGSSEKVALPHTFYLSNDMAIDLIMAIFRKCPGIKHKVAHRVLKNVIYSLNLAIGRTAAGKERKPKNG